MAAFTRFEDILAWQKARSVTKLIYDESRKGEFSRDFDLCRQIRRAAISIMANIAEGFGRHSDGCSTKFGNAQTAINRQKREGRGKENARRNAEKRRDQRGDFGGSRIFKNAQ